MRRSFNRFRLNIPYAIVFFAAMSALGWFANSFLPYDGISVPVFLLLLSLAAIGFFRLFAVSWRHSMLASLWILVVLGLRSMGLRDITYPILFGAVVLSIEYYLAKR